MTHASCSQNMTLPGSPLRHLLLVVLCVCTWTSAGRAGQATPPASLGPPVVAVFPFKVLNPEPRYAHYGEGAADAIINQFVREGSLKIVEEGQLDKAVSSLSRNQSGLFDEDNLLQVGQMIDARYIVLGSVDLVADQIAVTARVIEVESRLLLVGDRVHGPEANAFLLYAELAQRVSKALQRHLAARVLEGGAENADIVAVRALLADAKALDPLFGGSDLPGALALYRKAALRGPQNPVARFALGHALARTGSFADALGHLENAVSLKPDYVTALCWLGYTEDKLGRPEQGRARYRAALRLDPDSALANYWLAANLANAGEVEVAAQHARHAEQLGEARATELLRYLAQRAATAAPAR